MESIILWYNLYTKMLKYLVFLINPYERYTANSVIDGKRCTISCYVYENKVSHIK